MLRWLSEDTWEPTEYEWRCKAESGVASGLVMVKDSGVRKMIGSDHTENMY